MTPILLLGAAHGLSTQTASDPSIGSSLLKMLFGLAAVIASILVVSKILAYVRGGAPKSRSVSGLEVLSRQSLGKGLQLAVVRFSGREVLVGIAGQTITFYEEPGTGHGIPVESDIATLSAALAGRDPYGRAVTRTDEPMLPPSMLGVRPGFEADLDTRPAWAMDARMPQQVGLHPSGRSMIERLRDATARR